MEHVAATSSGYKYAEPTMLAGIKQAQEAPLRLPTRVAPACDCATTACVRREGCALPVRHSWLRAYLIKAGHRPNFPYLTPYCKKADGQPLLQ
jgi:hypothetical protein